MAGPGRRFTVLMAVAAVALVPWTVYLALTLPRFYQASHWRLVWVGLSPSTTVLYAIVIPRSGTL